MLVLDRLDRLLLGFVIFVVLVVATQNHADAQCDNKCREVKMFCWNLPGMGVQQYVYDVASCSNCTPTLVTSNCLNANDPLAGTCQDSGMLLNWYSASDCTCECTLNVGWRSEATGCTKGAFIATAELYQCAVPAGGG